MTDRLAGAATDLRAGALTEDEFQRDVIRELWGRLEERYEAARQEATLCEWAARAIGRAPERYSEEERLAWAVRQVQLVEELETLDRLWEVVYEADPQRKH